MKILKVNYNFLIKTILAFILIYLVIFFNSMLNFFKYDNRYIESNLLDTAKNILISLHPNIEITNKSILSSIENSFYKNFICCSKVNLSEQLKTIELKINNNTFDLLTSNLPESGRVFHSAELLYPDNKWKKIQLRLRGQSYYHHDPNFPSIRLNLKNDSSINYMNHINLTKPEDLYQIANFYSDFLFEKEGFITQKHEAVNLIINKVNFGLYHMHHRRDENLLRANKRLPGPIFNLYKFDMDPYWEINDFELKGELKLYDNKKIIKQLIDLVNSIDRDKNFENINLLWKIVNKHKFAKFYALNNIIGNVNSDTKHNLMLYFDPSLGKFEPIPDDTMGFGSLTLPRTTQRILNFNKLPDFKIPLYERSTPLYNAMLRDVSFVNLKNKYLKIFLEKYKPDSQYQIIDSIYEKTNFYIKNDIKKRSIQETLVGFMSIPMTNYDFKRNKSKLKEWIKNRHEFLEKELEVSNLKIEYFKQSENYIFKLNYKSNINILLKNKKIIKNLKINEVNKKYINYIDTNTLSILPNLSKTKADRYLWTKDNRYKEFFIAEENEIIFTVKNYGINKIKKLLEHSFFNSITNENLKITLSKINNINKNTYFVSLDESDLNNKKNNIILQNKIYLKKDLIIDTNQKLLIKPGTKIFMDEGVSIISYGRIEMLGTKKNNIKIFPSNQNKNWGVIALIGNDASKSIIKFSEITGGSNKLYNNIYLKGMLSIHWANNIKIENVKFHNNNIGDDVLNVVNSEIEIDNSLFEKCHMDCIDFDNSTGLIKNTKLYLAGNDLLDFMESNVKIQKTNLISAKDKCVSSGEKSFIKILETYFIDCNIGIASKDESIVNLSKSKFLNNKDNFSTYRKNFTYSSEGLIDEEI